MKYHQFTPDPETLATRMAGPAGDVSGEAAAGEEGPGTLGALLTLRDAAFVRAAYRVMAGREADPAGLEHYVRQLRSGAIDKIDVLGLLRDSPEGQRQATNVPGLTWRYAIRRLGRVKWIGWVVRWCTALLRLPALARTQQNHQAVAEEHAVAMEKVLAELRDLRAQLDASSNLAAELAGGTRALARRLTTFEERMAGVTVGGTVRHEANAGQAGPPRRQPTAPAADARDVDDWYVGFEDHFRGSREDVRRALEIYLPYVAVASAGTRSAPVLDLGCGRGEWLELLRDRGSVARGVDLNHTMVRENLARGLDVVEQDVLGHLAELPDGSVGMITGFHLIEHLASDVLVRLFDETRRVLRTGGCAVFETPNPENLVVSAYTFHLDPTHRHPLPPKMIEVFARERGFADVEIVRLHPREEPGRDDAFLDRWFRGPTDYAVIGWKDGRPAA